MIKFDENELKSNELNITLKKEESTKNEITIPLKEIFACLKRFFIIWLAAAILVALAVSVGTAAFSHQLSSAPVALIGFDYNGIKNGLTPDGKKFDVNSIKNPTVIEAALTKLGYPLQYVESVRSAIDIEGIVPTEAVDEISLYQASFEKSGSMQAAQAILGVSYTPTQYCVTFNFEKTPFGDDEAAQVINTVLECYRDYFFDTYGYNKAVGNASLAVDYADYDYLVMVDTYDNALSDVQEKVDALAISASPQFRSTKTGYSFADLSDAIRSIRTYDTDTLTAYILSNSVVRDKEGMISYYEYRIDELQRSRKSAAEKLSAITDSIEKYEKDAIIMYGSAEEDPSTFTKVSAQYDDLFEQKSNAQMIVSRYNQRIDECKARLSSVKNLGNSGANADAAAYVEERLSMYGEKVNTLIDDVNTTITEYNESVEFANAYSVLVPASVLSTSYVSMLLQNIMKPLLLVEAAVFMVYIIAAIVNGFMMDYHNKSQLLEQTENE